jgi:hypothetical protein
VVRSARYLAVLALTSLAGCATTQQEAARLQLNSARLRATEVATRISGPDADIRIERVALLSGAGGSAVVVRLLNRGSEPVSDLPIAVGVVAGRPRHVPPHGRRQRDWQRQRVYLNTATGLDYFSTHTPSIPAGGALTWVFTTPRRFGSEERAFAEVGRPASPAVVVPGSLPPIEVTAVRTGRGDAVEVAVRNRSSVPQYQLPVYAVVLSRGHYRAAGQTTIPHLGTGSTATVQLELIGKPGPTSIELEAPPTIFG